MSGVTRLYSQYQIPKFVKVKQYFPHDELSEDEIRKVIEENFNRPEIGGKIKPGMRICITGGSRGISNILLIDQEIVKQVKKRGGVPFMVPAMGSHGGATADGQVKILESFGITEETLGCPIVSSMETEVIDTVEAAGRTIDVNIDKNALRSDGIIVMNRIKAHTGFKGKYESGLMKMMTIGLGKQKGAAIAHGGGDDNIPDTLYAVGTSMIKNAPIIMGIGLMENAFDMTYKLAFLTPEDIPEKEPVLLEEAKAAMAKIFLNYVDVIILEKIGKNYSGGGMDPNVVGRSRLPIGIGSERMGIFDLSDESHGNATGMGRADVITHKMFERISFDDTYANAITDHDSSVYKIPLVIDNEKEVIQCSMAICLNMDVNNPRILILKNSLDVESMLISEALIPEAEKQDRLMIEGQPFELEFDDLGMLKTEF